MRIQDSRLKIQLFLLFIACCLLPIASFAVDADVIIDRIEKRYNEINDIKGTFTQKSFLKDIEKTEDYSGRFFIKKPSMIRWEYAGKRDEAVIINGDKLWIYKSSERQVLKGGFERGSYNQLPIALLQKIGDIKEDFYIKALKDNILELTPRTKMGIIKSIQLVTDDKFPIREFTIIDNYENRITIRISDVNINTNLSDSIFTFKIPPDVEVFDLN